MYKRFGYKISSDINDILEVNKGLHDNISEEVKEEVERFFK